MSAALIRRLYHLAARSLRRPVRTRPQARLRSRPWLEPLEDRTLPATYGPPSAVDITGTGATSAQGAASTAHSVSADGMWQVFSSSSTDIASISGLNGNTQVFLRNLVTGTTSLISVASDGTTPGNSTSFEAVLSRDGHWVAFVSAATNLAGGNGNYQIFVRDLVHNSTILASPGTGNGGNNTSGYYDVPSISDNGQVVAYSSYATDLVGGVTDNNGTQDVFAYNLGTGTTSLVSVSTTANTTGNGQSFAPTVSGDGSTVVFKSYANNLDPNATDGNNTQDIYARNLSTNVTHLVSAETTTAATANGSSAITGRSVSADGTWEVFSSSATDLIPGQSTNGQNVYLRNRTSGAVTLVSHSAAGALVGANNTSFEPVISRDGNWVAFVSPATDLPNGGTNGNWQVYVWHRTNDTLTLASPGTSGTGGNSVSGYYDNPSLSDDGQVVAYSSYASDLVSGVADSNGTQDVFAYNVGTGTTSLVSINTAGTDAGNSNSFGPTISGDGSTVVFRSNANNLDPNATDGNNTQDIYARNLSTNITHLVSAETTTPSTANSQSAMTGRSVSADGTWEVFSSYATDLIPGQSTNGQTNVYLRNRTTGAVTLVSHSTAGALVGGNSVSFEPALSRDGNWVAFVSAATDLPNGATNGNYQVYVWHRTNDILALASPGTSGTGGNSVSGYYDNPSLSDDGQVVAYSSYASDLVSGVADSNGTQDVFAYNLGTGTTSLVSINTAGTDSGNSNSFGPTISGDGSTVVFKSNADNLDPNATDSNANQDIYARNLSTNITHLVSAETTTASTANGSSAISAHSVSANDTWEVFSSSATDLIPGQSTNGQTNVYLRNRTTGAITLVSHNTAGALVGGNSVSFEPVISRDGNWVAFVSAATDLPNGATNGNYQVYVWHRTNDSLTLASPGTSGTGGNSTSGYYDFPSLSENGQVVAYSSYASDLVSGVTDSNGTIDVFAYNLGTGTTSLVSASTTPNTTGDSQSNAPVVSGDGSTVAFTSSADDLVSGITFTAGVQNVFVRHLGTSTTSLVSISTNGTQGANANAGSAVVNSSGNFVAYASTATNLNAGATSGRSNIFRRNVGGNQTLLMSQQMGSSSEANNSSFDPSISRDGAVVAFDSYATDLTNDNVEGNLQVYVRSGSTTTLLSPSTDGSPNGGGNNSSELPIISGDGGAVAFESYATNLVSGTTTNGNLLVYIRTLGSGGTLTLASPGTSGTGINSSVAGYSVGESAASGYALSFSTSASDVTSEPDTNGQPDVFDATFGPLNVGVVSARGSGLFAGNGSADRPDVSQTGQFVAFDSAATGLTDNDLGGRNVFVRDLGSSTTDLVSVNTSGLSGTGSSDTPSISADGSKVAFESQSEDLTSDGVTGNQQIYVRDRSAGATTLLTHSTDGSFNGGGNNYSYAPVLSADGGAVAFESYATNLISGLTTNGNLQVYVQMLGGGPLTLASPGTSGAGVNNSNVQSYDLSNGPGYVLNFQTTASDVTSEPDTNGTYDVFDATFGPLSVGVVSAKGGGLFAGNNSADDPDVSQTGQFVAFDSRATGLTDNDFGNRNVFVRDLTNSSTDLVSVNTSGVSGVSTSDSPSISADGSKVAFESQSEDLTSDGVTGNQQIYVRDRSAGTTTLLTLSTDGSSNPGGNNHSYAPVLSADGGAVAFESYATNLISGLTTNGNLQLYMETLGGGGALTLASPGTSGTGVNNSSLQSYDLSDGPGYVLNFETPASDVTSEPDTNGNFDVFDATFGPLSVGVVSAKGSGLFAGNSSADDPDVSQTGQFVAFDSAATGLTDNDFGVNNVFVRDLSSNSTDLVSVNTSGVSGNSTSQLPSISADGSQVAFESIATDLTNDGVGGSYQIYVRDRSMSTMTLLTPSNSGSGGGNNSSFNPVISADGSTVAFESAATDLVGGLTTNGFNQFYIKPLGQPTVLASPGGSGTGGNGNSSSLGVELNSDGTTLIFQSDASDLVSNDNNNTTDVFAVKSATLSIDSQTVTAPTSGTTTLTFTVTLSVSSSGTITVHYATMDGTAHSPGDYLATSGDLTFAPGVTSQPIHVTINGTTTPHLPETFTVVLSSPVNATIAIGTGTGTILTNDTAPVANDDSYSVHKNVTLSIAASGVLTNDTVTSSLTLTAAVVGNPSNGSVTLNGDGSFTYTPNSGFTGTDTFSYQDSDGILTSNVATVTLTVSDDAPVASDDSYSIGHNQTLTVNASGVLGNDSDFNGDSLTAVLVSNASHGTVTLSSDGSFTYTPTTGYVGSDSFTYQASDGTLTSNTAKVSINVTNTAPVAFDDSYSVLHDTTLTVTPPSNGVLANDTDADSDALTAIKVADPGHGTLTLNSDGTFTYKPNAGFTGVDSFTYEANDGFTNSNVATVTLNVSDNAPVANDDSYSAVHDRTLNVPASTGVLANDTDADNDPLTAVLVSSASHGSVSVNSDGSFTYTPNAGYVGPDSFTYQAFDGALLSSTATVSLTVTDANAPVANDDAYATSINSQLTVPASGVLGNDSDADGNALTAVQVSNPSNGTVTLNNDGSFTYTPSTGFTGTDSFTYQASDGVLLSNIATVTITVSSSAPTAKDDSYTAHKNLTLNVATPGVLGNDSDPNGLSLTAVLVTSTSHGSLTLNSDGSFSYTPTAGYTGADGFTYEANNGTLNSNIATVSLNVVNDAPVANDDSYTAHKNLTLNVAAAGVLANDSDPNGDPITAVLVTNASNGAVTLNSDGSFSYVPNSGFTGTDSFTYEANDGTLNSTAATVTLTVVDDAPTAVADSYSIGHNQTLTVNASGVLGNDTDPNGDTLTAVLVTTVSHGSLTLNSDGSFTYTPTAGYVGPDSFTYQASDGTLNSTTATVSLSVTNTAPVANADSYSTLHDTTLTVTPASTGVLANDTDPDNDPLTAVLVTNASHGSVSLNSDGTFTYTPTPGYVGSDSFTYQANDGFTNSNTATVTLSVTDNAPVAKDDSYGTSLNTALTVAAPGVLGNDTDADNDPLTAVLVSNPSSGMLTLNSDGSFTYTPNSGFTGTDSFTYEAFDGALLSSTATVSITVSASAPTANDDSYTAHKNLTLNVATPGVLGNDSDPNGLPLTAVLVTSTSHGSLTLNSDGSFSYTPTAGYTGTDSFTYEANNGSVNSNIATVTLNVVNDAPSASDDSYTAHKNLTLNVAATGVLANDSDPNGDPITAVLVSNASNGTVTLNSDGSFSYTPNAGFTGNDSFTYEANDGSLNSNIATVNLTVVNDAPVAVNDSYTAHKNLTLNVAATGVLANDSDPNGDPITAVLVNNASHGSLTLNSDGSFSYTPNAGYTGPDSFTYVASDGSLNSNIATVSLSVVDDAPTATDDSYTAHKNLTLSVAATGVLANDSDPNGDPLTAALVSNASHGTVALNSDGSFTYTPNAGYTGADSFTYQANDGTHNSNIATASLTVVNDAPTAMDDSYTAHKNVTLTVAASGVLSNDSDPNSDPLSAVLVSNASHGTVTLNSNGSFSYTPIAGYTGADSFTYVANDGSLNGNVATVSLTVVNDAPVANNNNYSVLHDHVLTVAAPGVLGNDSDPNGDQLSANLVSNVSHGTLTFNSDGSFTYTPTPGYIGPDSFTYQAGDGSLSSNVATVNISVVTTSVLTGMPKSFSITTGAPYNGVVASFTDSDPSAVPSQFTVSIRWDASTVTTGTVVVNGSGFDIMGTNTYGIAGTQTVIVTVQSPGSKTLTINSTATVTDSGQTIQSGQSASIAFWNGSNGQTLLQSFGGSSNSTALATWLASNFVNLFGAKAGSQNLTGKTNVEVAALFQTLDSSSATKLEAEVLATALNVYATTLSLGGTTAQSYGFVVTDLGLGAAMYNVGANGAAFGLYGNQSYDVYRLLKQINFKAKNGVVWSGNASLRSQALNVFDAINTLGGL